jgi:hypothetical protein
MVSSLAAQAIFIAGAALSSATSFHQNGFGAKLLRGKQCHCAFIFNVFHFCVPDSNIPKSIPYTDFKISSEIFQEAQV